MYFPQVLSWFGSVDSVLVWRFLEQWPDLESLRKARRSVLKPFWNAIAGVRGRRRFIVYI